MIRKLLSARSGFGLLVLAVAAASLAGMVSAQALPAGDPVQIFQSLTPEQQQAILERATGSTPGASSSSTGNRRATPASQAAEAGQRRRAIENREPLVPVLSADDTVVVELSLPPDSSEATQTPTVPV